MNVSELTSTQTPIAVPALPTTGTTQNAANIISSGNNNVINGGLVTAQRAQVLLAVSLDAGIIQWMHKALSSPLELVLGGRLAVQLQPETRAQTRHF